MTQRTEVDRALSALERMASECEERSRVAGSLAREDIAEARAYRFAVELVREAIARDEDLSPLLKKSIWRARVEKRKAGGL